MRKMQEEFEENWTKKLERETQQAKKRTLRGMVVMAFVKCGFCGKKLCEDKGKADGWMVYNAPGKKYFCSIKCYEQWHKGKSRCMKGK